MYASEMDMAIPHAWHQNSDMGLLEVREVFDGILLTANVFDLAIFHDDASILDGIAFAGYEEVCSDAELGILISALLESLRAAE